MRDFDFPEPLLGQSHTIVWRAHVYGPDGAEVVVLAESGSVTLSGRDRNRTRGDITLIDPDAKLWDPTGLTGASPYGGTVEVCAMIGEEECYVASGIILEVQKERPGGTVRVAFTDYGQAADWDQNGAPMTFAATDNLVGWLEYLLQMAFTIETIVDPGVPTTLAGGFVEEHSKETALQHICTDAGIVVWVDEHRRLRVQLEAVTAASPAVYTLSDGPKGTVTKESHGLSRDGVPNYIYVTGEQPQGDTPPPFGSAFVTSGPFNIYGPYGRVTELPNRPVLTTNAACDAAAATILAREGRLQRDLTVDAVAHPCLEPGDRIDTTLGGFALATILDEVRYNIGPDPMNVRLVEAL